jgi:hypothetical protein
MSVRGRFFYCQEFAFDGKVAESGVWRNTWGRKGVDIEKKSSVEIVEFFFVWPLSCLIG